MRHTILNRLGGNEVNQTRTCQRSTLNSEVCRAQTAETPQVVIGPVGGQGTKRSSKKGITPGQRVNKWQKTPSSSAKGQGVIIRPTPKTPPPHPPTKNTPSLQDIRLGVILDARLTVQHSQKAEEKGGEWVAERRAKAGRKSHKQRGGGEKEY